MTTLSELQAYVKKFYTTGLTWNPKGVEAAVKAGGAPPPPPGPGPPPPPPVGSLDLTAPDPAKNARADLLAALSKGSDVTKGLKKVTDDQKTHKNPELRGDGVVRAQSGGKTQSGPTSKPARTELDGKRWNIEYHNNNNNIVIEQAELTQSVYIYKCVGSTIMVSIKCF